ncbi:MAG TPA: peroxidase family protein [Herpetosiphonaceae bacterium]|nr:peroxidase family protein [Herpetosiphonaceae bacterium]
MQKPARNRRRDGLNNRVEYYVLTHFKGFWDFVQNNRFLRKKVNRALINRAIYKIPTRPYPFSTMGSYTSWDSLTDRTYTGRHLPPVPPTGDLPPVDEVVKLFERKPGREHISNKSTVLFSHFAQWFTDGFLRTDRTNPLKNTSTHDIDLCQLYGLNRRATTALRSHQGGKLKSQMINGEEYPPFYFNPDGTPRSEFEGLPILFPEDISAERKATLFAMGVERANVHFGYVMINTLLLREHNRICDLLAAQYPSWDDERLFQTARNIVIVLAIKIVIDEYINHITPYYFKFSLDPTAFPNERWYRQNWMSVEFSLVYRWHGLVPDNVRVAGRDYPSEETLFNTDLLTANGLGQLFEDASLQPAGEIAGFNTPTYLLDVERAAVELGRVVQLASYNDYRELCGYPRVTSFDQISGNPEIQRQLQQLYGHVDRVEFYVGLFSEDVRERSPVAPLMGRLVGIDAFSQALTNPLLAPPIFNAKTFTPAGLRIIEQTKSLSDLLHRNIPQTGKRYTVSLTRLDFRLE